MKIIDILQIIIPLTITIISTIRFESTVITHTRLYALTHPTWDVLIAIISFINLTINIVKITKSKM